MASSPLEFEDLSQTCRRDRFCQLCVRGFCSHCCGSHHSHGLSNAVIPVDIDAAGRPVFSTAPQPLPLPQSSQRTTPRGSPETRTACCATGSSALAPARTTTAHAALTPCSSYCVRCTGSEPWFPHVESILGDPVGEGVDEHGQRQLLLPVLRKAPGACVQCGTQVHWDFKQHCSEPCAAAHRREVALRRERREARSAGRELAELQIHYQMARLQIH